MVFTFSRVDFWVTFRDSPPQPSIDPQRSLRSERGTPRFRAHALPSDPCRTGHGRQAGQETRRQTKGIFAISRLWPVRRGYLTRELRTLMEEKGEQTRGTKIAGANRSPAVKKLARLRPVEKNLWETRGMDRGWSGSTITRY